MSEREAALSGLGVYVGHTPDPGLDGKSSVAPDLFGATIPSLSAFAEFTPITVRSYTTIRTGHADVERDQSRD